MGVLGEGYTARMAALLWRGQGPGGVVCLGCAVRAALIELHLIARGHGEGPLALQLQRLMNFKVTQASRKFQNLHWGWGLGGEAGCTA